MLTELATKELEILTEALPHARRIGVLWNPTTPSHPPALKALEATGEKLRVQLNLEPAQTTADLERAFASMTRERVGGFVLVGSPLFTARRASIAELALKHRLAEVLDQKSMVEAGGLMSYGADIDDLSRRAAVYVDKILKGARPAGHSSIVMTMDTYGHLFPANDDVHARLAESAGALLDAT